MRHDWRYAAWMLLGLLLSGLLLRQNQKRLQLGWRDKLGMWIGAFTGGMLGAKFPFLLAGELSGSGASTWLADGKTILTGIVGAYLGVEAAKWALEIRVRTGDTFALPAAVAVLFGRLACFTGGCCFGTPTTLPWGICFPLADDKGTIPRHPTQIYEAIFHGLMAGVLFVAQQRNWLTGQRIKFYILCYLGYRFSTEFIRPEARIFAGLTAYQWGTLILVPLFIALWVRDARQMKNEPPVAIANSSNDR